MSRWAWKYPSYFRHFGPVEARNEAEARELIRRKLGVTRLPKGIQVFDTAVKPMAVYVVREPLPLQYA